MDQSSQDLNKSPIQTTPEIRNQATNLIHSNQEICQDDLRKLNPSIITHTSDVIGLALARNNLHLITCGNDNTVRVWRIDDRVELEKFQIDLDSNEIITRMVFSKDERFLVFTVNFRFFLVWDLDRKVEIVRRFCDGEGVIRDIDVSRDSLKIALVGSEDDVKVFDIYGKI